MTAHRITYEGPSPMALPTVTLLADAEGIELTSAPEVQRGGELGGTALLVVTVEGTTDAVVAALGRIRDGLPPGASLSVDDQP